MIRLYCDLLKYNYKIKSIIENEDWNICLICSSRCRENWWVWNIFLGDFSHK